MDVWGKLIDAVNDERRKLFQRTLAGDKKAADLSLCFLAVSALGNSPMPPTILGAFGGRIEEQYKKKKKNY